MNSSKLFKDLSFNVVQTGLTQLAGLVIFYVLSRYTTKSEFGIYNWSTAVGSTIIAIASLGLDLVLVKRIAAGQDAKLIAGIHLLHTLIIASGIILTVCLLQILLPDLLQYHFILLLILTQLIINNVANSLKFSLTGLEAFNSLAIISVLLNMVKLTIVFVLLLNHYFSLKTVIYGFTFASCIELAAAYYFISKKVRSYIKPKFRKEVYIGFIVESLPQLGIVLFDSALARIDWILLGLFSTAAITGEYVFAYKFFELSKLPLLILAPVLLTRFSKLFQPDVVITEEKIKSIQKFFNLEMFIAFLIPIFMVCAWSNLIDLITGNKYGAVNRITYAILALCIPLHFMINFLWTMGFAQSQLKLIMYITIGVSIFNTVVNILLIPIWGSNGAALAFLAGTLLQFVIYRSKVERKKLPINLITAAKLALIATGSVILSIFIIPNTFLSGIFAVFFYVGVCLTTKIVRLNEIKSIAFKQ